jgi:hypothetical protein
MTHLFAIIDGKRKVVKKAKKKPYAGVLVSQMLAAREAEKQRINQTRSHEDTINESRINEVNFFK